MRREVVSPWPLGRFRRFDWPPSSGRRTIPPPPSVSSRAPTPATRRHLRRGLPLQRAMLRSRRHQARRARMFSEMEQILDQMGKETRFCTKEVLFCNVISSYGRARLAYPAVRTFLRIPSFRCQRTIRSFNSLLHALLHCRDFAAVEEFCRDMESYAVSPDTCTYNILINAYYSVRMPDRAWDLFVEMRRRGIQPSAVTFGTLISFLCSNSMLKRAFELKEEMMRLHNMSDEGVRLDAAVYSTLIKALFEAGRKGEVVSLLEEMRASKLEPDAVCYNAIISGFCGENDFTAAFGPDVVSYNVILSRLCRQGRYEDARELFDDMPRRGCLPTFRWKKAVTLLEEMMFKGYRPRPESLSRVVDGLGEADDVDSLVSLVAAAARGNSTDLSMWNTLTQRICREFDQVEACRLVDHLRV
ncbi:unnamed protein product [Spirodela intermedia]|uniref:Uncharacterized protein n=1 Tax=Spirodela intermedia TaxID=51605 RepID=A0A7I8ITL7_SPIIN|nr:unnamed protein product [Spirodela intermedia]CAA6661145.1 unnamed protein product [Spirodela intermedia]